MTKSSGFLKEFKAFAVRGNMVDLAVGVIIGAAFSKIVDSLVKDLVLPTVNFLVGGRVDFSNKFMVLREPANFEGARTYTELTDAGAIVLAWGQFITIFINFALLAFVIFWMVKLVNKARDGFEAEKPAPAPPAPAADIVLLTEIRDLLKK